MKKKPGDKPIKGQPVISGEDAREVGRETIRKRRAKRAAGQLTGKEEAFIEHYMRLGKVLPAFIAAGYSPKYARQNAYKVFNKPEVQKALNKRREDVRETTEFTIKRVISDLGRIASKAEDESKYADAIRALQLLGEHLGAFLKDRVQQHHHIVSNSEKTEDVEDDIKRLLRAIESTGKNIHTDEGNA